MTQQKLKSTRRLLSERRTSLRFPCQLYAICKTGGGKTGVEWQARVRNVSAKGAGLVLPRSFSPGTQFTVTFLCAGQPFVTAMQVIHCSTEIDGCYHGCAFLKRLDQTQVDALVK
jgi:hypothetical protein